MMPFTSNPWEYGPMAAGAFFVSIIFIFKMNPSYLLTATGEDGPPMLFSPSAVGISFIRAK